LVHGGAGTPIKNTHVVLPAVEAGWKKLAESANALDAAIAAVIALEDEPTLNAGTGSNIRMDGVTVQMDAAVMNETGDFGAVSLIERVKNPVVVAREVMKSPHLLIAGDGATRFARKMGIPDYDPRTPESQKRYEMLLGKMSNGGLGEEWKDFDWKTYWNFPTPLDEVLKPKDTVGAVVRDGEGGFAAAISTGGTSTTFYGRVGDVPIMGAGIYAGPHGAVATTGWGEYIIREMLARRVYDFMAAGDTPEAAVQRGLALYPAHIGVGVIAIGVKGEFAAANTQMAWAGMADGKMLRPDAPAEPTPVEPAPAPEAAPAPPPAPEPVPAPAEPAPAPVVEAPAGEQKD